MDRASDNNFVQQGGTLDLQISDPVSMLNEVARRYESTERILMEYVDNALDDAEALYREHEQSYPYEIHIDVTLDIENRSVTVRDNCRGMEKETLERIVRNVGESQKRGLTWVNGRFGFGVQAFRAAAEVIRFQTKHEQHPHLTLELQRDQHVGIKGARSFAEPFPSDTGTGTLVEISLIEDEWFESITVGSIRQEIESHFERLLARPNLAITVAEAGQEPVVCKPFRYRDIPGQNIERTLNLKYNGAIYPVEIHLKVAEVEAPGRTVRFFARGRRVNQVAEIKSFIRKSAYRTSVWGHPHLLGYIEVGEIVRPVITRDDFVRSKGRNIFYEAILGLEDEIKNALDRVNEAQRDTTLNRLEDVLREVLASLARQDRRQLRLHTAAKRKAKIAKLKETNDSQGVNLAALEEIQQATMPTALDALEISASGELSPLSIQEPPNNDRPPLTLEGPSSALEGSASASEARPANGLAAPAETSQAAPVPGPEDEVKFSYEVEQPQQSPTPPRHRRNSFDIQFYDIPPDADGQVKRSYLVDSTIYINVGHPDFQERMIYTRQGQPKVTDRLGAYIAATVSIHYKDQFYKQYGYIPERRDLMFDEQVDFIFRLEAALREHLPALERELGEQKKAEGMTV